MYLKKVERNNNRGFTLIELLVVLSIIGLLAGLVGPQVMKHLGGPRPKLPRCRFRIWPRRWICTSSMSGPTRPPAKGWRRWWKIRARSRAGMAPICAKTSYPKTPGTESTCTGFPASMVISISIRWAPMAPKAVKGKMKTRAAGNDGSGNCLATQLRQSA